LARDERKQMTNTAKFAEIALLAGEPSRAIMLHALMDGRALTASELANAASIAPQTASGHLARMIEAGLLSVVQQGRHRYHKLASPAVAHMMESIMLVASVPGSSIKHLRTGPRDVALRAGRTCYDHLAGRLGVALTDALVAQGHAELEPDVGTITETGQALFMRLGIEIPNFGKARSGNSQRILCRPCLDWSERRAHLAGTVGTALCKHSFANDWIRRIDGTRAVSVTPKGYKIFREALGADLSPIGH
jgi:DNA-binding transcriptional ArsR family regulator